MEDNNKRDNKKPESNIANLACELKKNILPKLSYPELDQDGKPLTDENGNPKMREVAIYYPKLHEPPPEETVILSFNGEPLLYAENLLVFAAYIGVGKSSISGGAILANALNPGSDSIGFKYTPHPDRPKVFYLETEMSKTQNYNLLWKVYKRAYRDGEGHKFKTNPLIQIISTKKLSVFERKALVVELIKQNPDIGLLILDGAGDFVVDTNDLKEANAFYGWLAGLSPHITIICTIHVNSPSNAKPRGHIGSELLRRADASLFLQKLEENLYEITTEYEYGKNRSAAKQSVYYEWSFDQHMFVTKHGYTPEKKKPIKKEKMNQDKTMCELIFANIGNKPLSHSYLTQMIAGAKKIKATSAKSAITKLVNDNIIKKIDSGEYQLFEL